MLSVMDELLQTHMSTVWLDLLAISCGPTVAHAHLNDQYSYSGIVKLCNERSDRVHVQHVRDPLTTSALVA